MTNNKDEFVKIILDSNALFTPLQFKIDIFEEAANLLSRNIEFILLSQVKHELELLVKKSSPKTRKNALYALKLSEKCRLMEVNNTRDLPVDDVILKAAKDGGMVVFTNDINLRKRLRDISVPVIYVRQKSRLEIDGLI